MGSEKLTAVSPESADAMLRALKPPVNRERMRELTERRRLSLHVSRMELCDGIDGLLAETASLERELAELRGAADSLLNAADACVMGHCDRDDMIPAIKAIRASLKRRAG